MVIILLCLLVHFTAVPLLLTHPIVVYFFSSQPNYHMCFLYLHAALEPRVLTRWDVHKFARRAYHLGVRYIGGCCGFESYHIRAIAEEVPKLKQFNLQSLIAQNWTLLLLFLLFSLAYDSYYYLSPTGQVAYFWGSFFQRELILYGMRCCA